MNKREFLTELRRGLSGLPRDDMEERLSFYAEMIDDRMEEGLSEEEAAAAIGPVDSILSQISADTPLTSLVKEKLRTKKRMSAGVILLLVLGSPLWLSLLIACFAVVLALYAAVWALIISLWAIFVSLVLSTPAGIAAGIVFTVSRHHLAGVVMISAAMICAGLSILVFFGSKAATKGILFLTGKPLIHLKSHLMKQERVS